MKNTTPILIIIAVFTLGLFASSCRTQQETGTLVGAGLGGTAGALIGDEAGAIVGAAVGGVLGNVIGREMDLEDRRRFAYALENTPTYRTQTWIDPDQDARYSVTPTRTFYLDDRRGPCREFRMLAEVDGRPQELFGTACRQPDGSWQIVEG